MGFADQVDYLYEGPYVLRVRSAIFDHTVLGALYPHTSKLPGFAT